MVNVVVGMAIKLKEVCIDDKFCCYNVKATVIDNAQAPLLLGNGLLDRVETVTIDNENKTLNFKLK